MTRVTTVLAVVALLGCRERPGDRSGGAAGGHAPAMTPAELYADYERRQGADLLDRYEDGVVVKGAVSEAVDLGEEGLRVALDAGPGRQVEVRFRDDGAAARARGLAAGHAVTLACRVGGMPDEVLFLTDCDLR